MIVFFFPVCFLFLVLCSSYTTFFICVLFHCLLALFYSSFIGGGWWFSYIHYCYYYFILFYYHYFVFSTHFCAIVCAWRWQQELGVFLFVAFINITTKWYKIQCLMKTIVLRLKSWFCNNFIILFIFSFSSFVMLEITVCVLLLFLVYFIFRQIKCCNKINVWCMNGYG